MNQLLRWAMMACLTLSLGACAGGSRSGGEGGMAEADVIEDEFADFDSPQAPASPDAEGFDDFADFDEDAGFSDPPAVASGTPAEATPPPAAGADEFDDFDFDEPAAPAQAEASPTEPVLPPDPSLEAPPTETDDFGMGDQAATPEESTLPPEPTMELPPAPAETAAAPEPAPESDWTGGSTPTITSIQFKSNEAGGTLVIEANGPISHTTRSNPELGQMIVEVPNAILPKRLQRPLNTRDIQGSIGSIDAYQNSGSNVARFVIQLRPGAADPIVQQEGNTLLVVANTELEDYQTGMSRPEPSRPTADFASGEVLPSYSLDDFLMNNTKFYGRKISLEVSNMEIGEAFRFLTEESGVNMVVAEDVKGTVSLKLRQVPWDQALVVLMKAKNLGYTRQGNVLRIAPLEQLRREEEEAHKVAASRQKVEALQVKVYPVSYAQVADLEKKVQSFLTERGKVVADVRTNSLVVTDVQDTLIRVGQLVQSLDTQPPQVLIEGKIIEATETFLRTIGVNWRMSGSDINMGSSGGRPLNLRPSLAINPLASAAGSALNFGLNLGVLDGLGDLSATLALNEQESKIRILSSPRVVTMTNEAAKISQTNEVPVRQVTQNGTATQTSFTFKPLTLLLDVTPQITADASVIMKVNVKREFAGSRDPETGEFPVNGREANTRVLVQNGQTAVIGGIYQSDEATGETGVPGLRNLPVIGGLFRARTVDRAKTELLVFLTPRILAPGQSGNGASAPGTN